jgi:hypothetical protein
MVARIQEVPAVSPLMRLLSGELEKFGGGAQSVRISRRWRGPKRWHARSKSREPRRERRLASRARPGAPSSERACASKGTIAT